MTPPSDEALFRYGLVSAVLAHIQRGQTRSQAISAVVTTRHPTFDGSFRRVSKRTVYRWLADFREQGLDGLEPPPRPAGQASRVLDTHLLTYLSEQKSQDPQASIPELLRRAQASGILSLTDTVDRTTVWRALRRMHLPTQRRRTSNVRDSRRFAYSHRLQMILCDGKHFRAGATRAKRVAFFYLDDATRYVLNVVVGTSENPELFLRGLYGLCRRFGKPDAVYIDRGSGFFAHSSESVILQLPALYILGEARYPQGHGKIEKLNQTVKKDVLRHYDGRPDIDPYPLALEQRLGHYLREQYNRCPHESLGGRTPFEAFHSDERNLQLWDSEAVLREKFILHLRRKVTNDHIVSVDSIHYEMPLGTAKQSVLLRRSVLDQSLSYVHQGQLISLQPVDLAANARATRARTDASQDSHETSFSPTYSAADIAFNRELGAIVEPDGGYSDPT